MLKEFLRRGCALMLCVSLVAAAMPQAAQASMIGTMDVIALEQHADSLASTRAALAREDVRERLVALGVDPAGVDARLAALTAEELAQLSGKLEELPAGAGVLEVLGIVLLVLLVLEFTGAIDIFKKVP
ncbi:MAG: PA2779 family protein [Steroidobacteraceae bacterium]|jgi:hypothetical protein|nr:PA2779 family protein [Steroidobacteraceae bacterium]